MERRSIPILLVNAQMSSVAGQTWAFGPHGAPGSCFYANPNDPNNPAEHFPERDYIQYNDSGDVAYLGQEMGLLSESSLEYARSFYPEAVFLDTSWWTSKGSWRWRTRRGAV